jgi:hypothetical protein
MSSQGRIRTANAAQTGYGRSEAGQRLQRWGPWRAGLRSGQALLALRREVGGTRVAARAIYFLSHEQRAPK